MGSWTLEIHGLFFHKISNNIKLLEMNGLENMESQKRSFGIFFPKILKEAKIL